jgi:hypothetical protein
VIGAESAVKAAHAMLASDNGWATFQFDAEASGMYRWNDHTRAPQGYTTYRARASLNNWHFLFVAKTPGLLLSMDEASVWRELRSERYTTPILREWVMYLIRKLKDDHCLETLGGFGHNAGLLTADSDDLDKIVKNGLRHRKLRIQ